MGFYTDHIFPRLMEAGLKGELHERYRRRALARARGRVLEIGFGTGLNLEFFPQSVERLVALDPVEMLERRTHRRMRAAPFPVERVTSDAADLPFENATFDTVVSTWTLCSIERLGDAIRALRRTLDPDGEFLFLEHGRSERRFTAGMQNALNPLQNRLAGGCNLNREIDHEIEAAGFRITELDRFRIPGMPRALGTVYLGAARTDRATPGRA